MSLAEDIDVGIWSDGRTVWVDKGAYTVGRFGVMGIDVHTADASGCLDCTHEVTDRVAWRRFQESMLRHHGIIVPDRFMPMRIAKIET